MYKINKGINKSIEFKGLKAQYIWYMGGGMVGLLILFAVLYIAGINSILCICIIATGGSGLVVKVYSMSRRYGEHGLMKAIARRGVPKVIKVKSRTLFKGKSDKK